MSYTGQDFVSAIGTVHPILRGADRGFYLADPEYHFAGPHKLFLEQGAIAPPGQGLGDATVQAGIQAAAVAANFIPVVGPFVSAALSIGGSLFGGGDPTPLSTLIGTIVDTREQIAQATNHIAGAVVDPFTIPAGFNDQDKAGTASLVEGIVESAIGVTAAHIQKNRRADYYAAIKALQSTLAQIQQQGEIRAGIAAALLTPAIASSSSSSTPIAPAPAVVVTPSPAPAPDYNSVTAASGATTLVAQAPPLDTVPIDAAPPPSDLVPATIAGTAPSSTLSPEWILAGGALVVVALVLKNR